MARACLVILLLALGVPGWAQEGLASRIVLPGEDAGLAKRLQEVDKLLTDQQWADALDELQRILEEAGDHLVPLDARERRHCIEARRLCQLRLAALPPAALRLYRQRLDARARQWLDEGRAMRDPAPLRRLVEETFASRHTAEALDLLGDLAFERGEFTAAEHWWRMLAPLTEAGPLDLVVPDAPADPARARAKQLLARLFRGDLREYAAGLAAFRAAHATAQGHLAGQQGVYAEILDALGRQHEELLTPPRDASWQTFAGDPSRTRVLPAPPGRLARLRALEGPTWRVRLDAAPEASALPGRVVPPSVAARSLAFYPVIAGGRVLVAGPKSVHAHDLLTGRLTWQYLLDGEAKKPLPLARVPLVADRAYTLTVADDCVYARLGDLLPTARRDEGGSVLVCLDLQVTGGNPERWRVPADAGGPPAAFEGAPVAARGRVYAALYSPVGDWTQTAIACYGADGTPLWRADVCKTQDPKEGERRPRQHLLTLAGTRVVYCSHTGAVVALDAATGRRAWAVRYSSRGPRTAEQEPSPRSLAPCVVADGRVFVAPLDFDRLLCLDAETGRLLWESEPVEAVHLLGVARGRLIFTSGTPRPGIRAVEAATGRMLRAWMQPADGSDLPSFGRGLLAGDLVLWPTRDGLRVLRQEDGEPVLLDGLLALTVEERLRTLGNLAAGEGCLAVAGTEELSVFVPEELLLDRRRQEAVQPDASAAAQYLLGLAAADSGRVDEALRSFERAAGSGTPRDSHTLLEARARQRQHELLLDLAAQAQRGQHLPQALDWLERAAQEPFSPGQRLSAWARQAALWQEQGQTSRAAEVWQRLADDPAARAGSLRDDRGLPQPARLLAQDRLAALRGSTPRAATPRPTPALLRVSGPGDPPFAEVWQAPAGTAPGPEHCLPQGPGGTGRLLTWQRGAGAAAGAGPGWLVQRDEQTGTVRWRAALDAMPAWVGAHGDALLLVDAQAVRALDGAEGTVRWTLDLAPAATDDGPGEPAPPAALAGGQLFVLHEGRRLLALEAGTGRVLWERWAPAAAVRPLPPGGCFHPHFHADERHVVLQTGMGLRYILESRTGSLRHETDTSRAPWPHPPQPLAGDRLCLVPDAQRVVCLDPTTGKEVWTYRLERWPSLSGAAPQVLVRGQVLLVLVDRNYGQELERRDPETGQRLWQVPQPVSRQAIDLAAAVLDDTALYFVAHNTLVAHAVHDGRRLWAQALAGPAGPWRVFRAGRHLGAYPLRVRAPEKLPLVFCEPAGGRVVQRLEFPLRKSRVAVQCGSRGLVLALGDELHGLFPAAASTP